ncbi:MAG TPA: hypothetical protein VJ385_03635 [Fibrobacteria bacterium]|nr:hypothetical protein [Fibrobacteria bacterium]
MAKQTLGGICAFLLISACALASPGRGQVMDGHDFLLSAPYALKTAAPLFLLPNAFDDVQLLPFEALLLGTLTFPNAMTLRKVYSGDAEGARRWRNRVFWCDAGLSAVTAGLDLRLRIPI